MVYKGLWGKIGQEAPLIETALHTFVHVEQPGKIGQHIRQRRLILTTVKGKLLAWEPPCKRRSS